MNPTEIKNEINENCAMKRIVQITNQEFVRMWNGGEGSFGDFIVLKHEHTKHICFQYIGGLSAKKPKLKDDI